MGIVTIIVSAVALLVSVFAVVYSSSTQRPYLKVETENKVTGDRLTLHLENVGHTLLRYELIDEFYIVQQGVDPSYLQPGQKATLELKPNDGLNWKNILKVEYKWVGVKLWEYFHSYQIEIYPEVSNGSWKLKINKMT